MKNLSNWFQNKFNKMEKKTVIFSTIVIICSLLVVGFLSLYFQSYENPYMEKDIYDLSENWQYQTSSSDTDMKQLETLRTGPMLKSGETITLYKTLDIEMTEAALLVRTNLQSYNVYLDDVPLFLDKEYAPNENPGRALHFLTLPNDYLHKTLKVEITSPYKLYAGRTNPIFMGTISSLEAYVISSSMRSVVLMAMCLLLGFAVIALTLIQAFQGFVRPENLSLGIFAVVWALHYVCTEFIVYQFFTPVQVAVFGLTLYFSFQVPLTLFFYFSFEHYKKQMLPAVILHSGFIAVALTLQVLGIVDLPQILNINNTFLAGLIYTVVLAVLEACKGNRLMMLAAPLLIIAYVSMLYNFNVFYARHGVVPYSFRDTYFLLILLILVYNIQQFFSGYYRGQREGEILLLQNRLANESYEQIKTHLLEVGGLKHEICNHLSALQMYLSDGKYEELQTYLSNYTAQTSEITDAVHHEHYLINAVANKLIQSAEEIGVTVELNLKASPVHISAPDLYSLMNNITENALEACAYLPQGENRFIRLTVARREPYFRITCENSKTAVTIEKGGKLKTTKPDPSGHGYGLRTIERIVNAYDGIMDTEYNDNTFTITVALKD